MMRIKWSLLIGMVATGVILAASAGADATVDLIWADGGGSTLTIAPNDAGGSPGTTGGPLDGYGPCTSPTQGERCMQVVLTIDTEILAFGIRLSLDSTSGLGGVAISQFKSFASAGGGGKGFGSVGPVGTPVFSFGGNPDLAGDFTGAGAGAASKAGTFTIGTIVWDTSGVTASSVLSPFLGGGQQIVDGSGNPLSAGQILLNSANLIVPEPATISLIGLGILGLGIAGRRRNR